MMLRPMLYPFGSGRPGHVPAGPGSSGRRSYVVLLPIGGFPYRPLGVSGPLAISARADRGATLPEYCPQSTPDRGAGAAAMGTVS